MWRKPKKKKREINLNYLRFLSITWSFLFLKKKKIDIPFCYWYQFKYLHTTRVKNLCHILERYLTLLNIVKATNFYYQIQLSLIFLIGGHCPLKSMGGECVCHWTFLSIAWKDGIWHPFFWSPILSSFKV